MDVLRTFPKLRTLMDQRIGVKNAKFLGYLAQPGGLLPFGNVSISPCDEKPNEKFLKTLFHFSCGREYHPTS